MSSPKEGTRFLFSLLKPQHQICPLLTVNIDEYNEQLWKGDFPLDTRKLAVLNKHQCVLKLSDRFSSLCLAGFLLAKGARIPQSELVPVLLPAKDNCIPLFVLSPSLFSICRVGSLELPNAICSNYSPDSLPHCLLPSDISFRSGMVPICAFCWMLCHNLWSRWGINNKWQMSIWHDTVMMLRCLLKQEISHSVEGVCSWFPQMHTPWIWVTFRSWQVLCYSLCQSQWDLGREFFAYTLPRGSLTNFRDVVLCMHQFT
jgi:hypothetical protein